MNLREWALPVYTILMQLATGALLALWMIRMSAARDLAAEQINRLTRRPLAIIWFTILVAMVGSHFHLSQPLVSFLAVLNFQSSWLSREISFTVLMFITATAVVLVQWFRPGHSVAMMRLGWLAVLWGFASIYCMSQIYNLPAQVAWNSNLTTVSFYATTILLGAASLAAMLLVDSQFRESMTVEHDHFQTQVLRQTMPWLAGIASISMAVAIWLNVEQIRLLQAGSVLAQVSLELLLNLYGPLVALRIGALVLGVASIVFAAWRIARARGTIIDEQTSVSLGFVLILVSEISGRFLFYATHIRVGI